MKNWFYVVLLISFTFSCKQSEKQTERNASVKPADATSNKYSGCCTSKTTDKDWYASRKKAPKFTGLDGINFVITTNYKEAQEYFNQGMMLSYGFNHAEAARSFYEATRIDSTCAMCFWGYAYVLGPNYNGGMEEDNFERAFVAAQKALTLSADCTEKEKYLIDALAFRYSEKPPEDRKPLDIAYNTAMKKVYDRFSSDPDVGALYAESLMDLHPWDLYEKKTKKPKAWTPELLSVLEHLMEINPSHPGAHHFYIHAVEASATPEKGLPSAKFFETQVPGSGHLVHMPSHIYINTGNYHLASLANINAIKVDSNYFTTCHAQGAYPLAYFPHNYHFLAATATLEGNSKLAWSAAKEVQLNTAADIMSQPGWGTLQHYYTIPYYVAIKFGMWDTILNIPLPEEQLIYPRAVLHYARGMAYLGKKNIPQAQKELAILEKLSEDSVLKTITIWDINTTYELMQIAVKVLSAEIYQQQKNYTKSIQLLNEAVALEDQLNYNEPPDWFFSIRHHLGAVLLKAGKFPEAEKIYLEDLSTWRENGWALIGLYNSFEMQNKNSDAAEIKIRFDKAWKFADKPINSSSSL
ncbi:MAG: tetratricopeptide repeat protein [Chitinophagaceae bacterium]|nr:tetratricopeptide repeat protein [Chitinophagaceae bacterium]